MKKKPYCLITVLILASCSCLEAQIDTSSVQVPLSFTAFWEAVGSKNLEYAAERFNVRITEAGIESARVFPDPELSLGASDNGQHRMRMGYTFSTGVSWVLETGGKRKARIQLAQSQTALSKAMLEAWFHNLRADATLAWLTAMKQQKLMEVQSNSYNNMNNIAVADSIRFKLGSIAEIDARQSQLEARSMLNEVYRSEADWTMALVQVAILMGRQPGDTLLVASGDFNRFDRSFELLQLITAAQNNRADLLAALRNKQVAQDVLQLSRANRSTDLGLNAGVSNTSVVSNVVAPTPSFTTLSAGIAIPLKFSNKYKGEMKAAQLSVQQSEIVYKQTELQIQGEVMQAWHQYQAARKRVRQFNTGLLADAKQVLEGKMYSYRRGEISLLEVLIAQRTYNDTQLNYYETLYEQAAALIELEKAAGIWDIQF